MSRPASSAITQSSNSACIPNLGPARRRSSAATTSSKNTAASAATKFRDSTERGRSVLICGSSRRPRPKPKRSPKIRHKSPERCGKSARRCGTSSRNCRRSLSAIGSRIPSGSVPPRGCRSFSTSPNRRTTWRLVSNPWRFWGSPTTCEIVPKDSTTWSRPPTTRPTPSAARTCSRSAAAWPATATRHSPVPIRPLVLN